MQLQEIPCMFTSFHLPHLKSLNDFLRLQKSGCPTFFIIFVKVGQLNERLKKSLKHI